MKALILAIAGIALIGASVYMMHTQPKVHGISNQVMTEFKQWKHEYGKSYGDPDMEEYRLQVFNDNYRRIQYHQGSYTMGINQFMDLTQEEFAATYLTLLKKPSNGNNIIHEISGNDISNDVNWVTKGAVTPIKNQGMCGSCWAFSTTGCLEGISFIWGGKLQSFSEQQLVDCSGSYGNMGCNGGLMDYAFEYVIANGICTEAQYPYQGVDNTCRVSQFCSNPSPTKIIGSYADVPSGNCDALTDAINIQPVSIGVDAETWQFYSGGVFNNCGTQLDHGVTAVGYTSNYWLVKNSWGTSWGMQGYIELAPGNTCGICNTASYGVYA